MGSHNIVNKYAVEIERGKTPSPQLKTCHIFPYLKKCSSEFVVLMINQFYTLALFFYSFCMSYGHGYKNRQNERVYLESFKNPTNAIYFAFYTIE